MLGSNVISREVHHQPWSPNNIPWPIEQNYALAFGAALGMQAGAIGLCLSKTRNAVIGRAYRAHLEFNKLPGIKTVRRRSKIRSTVACCAPLQMEPA